MSAEPEPNYVRSREAAKRLGVKTRTLARWRQQGKGPSGWFRMGPTATIYPLAAITEFMEEQRASECFEFNFQRAAGNASELA
jgi:transposase-like protein